MPFLKEFTINEKTKIKLWKVALGEIDHSNLDDYDRNLLDLKKKSSFKRTILSHKEIN